MKRFLFLFSLAILAGHMQAQLPFVFDFSGGKAAKNAIPVNENTLYQTSEQGFGYDILPAPAKKSNDPWFFSIELPDGNYRIRVVIGSKKEAAVTTLRGESRRLFVDRLATKKGETVERVFIVNKRGTKISDKESVKIKERERGSLTWDDKITLEINGDRPRVQSITIERDDKVPTIFLCGNSTVVDQRDDPWASWGQMLPVFLTDEVAVANYAESGESASSFLGAGRLKKILTEMKEGDFVAIEFGHNDQKQKGPGKGAYYNYMTNLKTFVDEVRENGGTPLLVTPTRRRNFDEKGKITNTHADYPEAMRWLAEKENVALIDLHAMTKVLFEALGVENSKNALVHYPANTYPNQETALADNTHFNPYGAYEVAKCVVEGLKSLDLPLKNYIRADYVPFDPAKPDNFDAYVWDPSPFVEIEKPEGN
ncbi:rhamnogalacturonan acetylesterase [Bacteroidales bacterium OttesenSCG-928-L03]|nr:rhamnogalacturonan acetylesterase [Bacteroidales bacterium OttesenSCG-928-L03]